MKAALPVLVHEKGSVLLSLNSWISTGQRLRLQVLGMTLRDCIDRFMLTVQSAIAGHCRAEKNGACNVWRCQTQEYMQRARKVVTEMMQGC